MVLGSSPAVAQDVSPEQFYRGKTVQLMVVYSAGGGYDTYARTVARHLGKHIPGIPM
jgi:tripartite-type tricarboxylate transporter receptor subunit TctC